MSHDVASLFDRMAGAYEDLEPWYQHLYERLHTIVTDAARPGRPPHRALDAGCGTGFQTAVLRDLGFVPHGVDLSAGLLAVARGKLPGVPFVRGDLEALPYRDESVEIVTCCGSTLSFVEHPARALTEIGRVLRPGGTVVVEFEHKWSLDLAWGFVSALTGDALGYGVSLAAAVRQVARPLREGFRLDYPVALPDGAQAYMRLRLFTMAEIGAMLRPARLVPRRVFGIHAVTNLLPSTLLHRARLPGALDRVYRALAALDGRLTETPVRRLANSVVVVASKC